MFNRVLVFTCLFTTGLVGCSLNRQRDCGCGEHGIVANSVNTCGDSNACNCTPPLFPGDQACQANCRQHGRQRPLRRMVTTARRSAPSWFRNRYSDNCGCGACGVATCSGPQFPYGVDAFPYSQTVCSPPAWNAVPCCGFNAGEWAVTSDWQMRGGMNADAYLAMPGVGNCGCGEQFTPEGSFPSGGNWEYLDPGNSPVMHGHGNPPQGGARTFAPSGPQMLPIPPDSSSKPAPMPPNNGDQDSVPMPMPMPMPQDLTPMELDSDIPKNSLFDPLSEEAAPKADSPLDPVSYEVPLLPPLPIPDHASSGKRVALPYAK